jgi:hypothetical protein
MTSIATEVTYSLFNMYIMKSGCYLTLIMYSLNRFILNNIYASKYAVCNNECLLLEWMRKGDVLSTIYQCPHYNETYVSYRLNPPYIYKETVGDDKNDILGTKEIEGTEILINIQ